MANPTHDWLPERHLGVAATLSHADELIGQVSDLLMVYQTQDDGLFGMREVRVGPVSRTVVDRVAPIPRKVPLLVADALVALRAALEHVLFAEVEFLEAPANEGYLRRRVVGRRCHRWVWRAFWIRRRRVTNAAARWR